MLRILDSGSDWLSPSLGKFLNLCESLGFLSVNGDDSNTYLIGRSGGAMS